MGMLKAMCLRWMVKWLSQLQQLVLGCIWIIYGVQKFGDWSLVKLTNDCGGVTTKIVF